MKPSLRIVTDTSGILTTQEIVQGLEILCQYAIARHNREVAEAIQTCLCDILHMELSAEAMEGTTPYDEAMSLFGFVLDTLVPMI